LPGFVEHPCFRLQSDIDVYCPPESIYHARDALSSLGYEPTPGEFGHADHLPPMVLKTNWKWRGNHYDPEMPVSFELHFCFWNESFARFGPKGLDQFWPRRVERRLDNFSFPALSPVDSVGYLALNVLRDALRGPIPIHLVYELARFLHTNADNEEFWKNWRELHDETLRCLEVVSFRLASHCFACRLSEEIKTEINRMPTASKVWFQKYADSPLSASFRPNKDTLLLHLTLINSPRDKRAVLFKRLFPTRIQSVEAVSIQNAVINGQESSGVFRKQVRYVGYLTSRSGRNTRAALTTLWHGVRFWLSTKNKSKGFWTFLCRVLFF
jgi:putative nucleotidyltransferase-like protein